MYSHKLGGPQIVLITIWLPLSLQQKTGILGVSKLPTSPSCQNISGYGTEEIIVGLIF